MSGFSKHPLPVGVNNHLLNKVAAIHTHPMSGAVTDV